MCVEVVMEKMVSRLGFLCVIVSVSVMKGAVFITFSVYSYDTALVNRSYREQW